MSESEKVKNVNENVEVQKDTKEGEDLKNAPDNIEEILEEIPVEERREVVKMVRMTMQMGKVMSPESGLIDKMTSEHITTYLEGQKEAMKNQFKENKENKFFALITLIVVLVFVVILVILLKETPDVMEKVIYTLGGLVTGALGGYGIGKAKKDD